MQKKLMRRSIPITNRLLIEALKSEEKSRPRLFTESSFMKECYPLWLENGFGRIMLERGSISIRLHPQLGLVIQKEKEAN
jgi:hypothetical protein